MGHCKFKFSGNEDEYEEFYDFERMSEDKKVYET